MCCVVKSSFEVVVEPVLEKRRKKLVFGPRAA